jgi:glucose-6-phosphate 1-dehydrogenase
VPFLLRAGKRLPVTQTEVRVIFRAPPRLGFLPAGDRRPAPSQLVLRIDPETGLRIVLDAKVGGGAAPREIDLDLEFADVGGEAATPYEVLLHAAIAGDSTHFTRQDLVEETWRILQPLLDAPGAAQPYAQGSWGPDAARELATAAGGWHSPWIGR